VLHIVVTLALSIQLFHELVSQQSTIGLVGWHKTINILITWDWKIHCEYVHSQYTLLVSWICPSIAELQNSLVNLVI